MTMTVTVDTDYERLQLEASLKGDWNWTLLEPAPEAWTPDSEATWLITR